MNNYLKYIQEVLSQLNKKGYCEDAKLLNEKIGNNYFDISSPHFFTGNLNAGLVMVQLNAKRGKSEFNKLKVVNLDATFLYRNVNEGFSGGEKNIQFFPPPPRNKTLHVIICSVNLAFHHI